MNKLLNQAEIFFEKYQTTFDKGDMGEFSKLFSEPFISVRSNGAIQSMPTNQAAADFFTTVLTSWKQEGYDSFSTKEFEVQPIGNESMLVTLTWQMLNSSKNVIREWRQSYNLVAKGESWAVITSTFHVG